MRISGWTVGSALSRTISPSLCGSTGFAARSSSPRRVPGARTRRRNTERYRHSDSRATSRDCSRRERKRSARRDCGGRQGRLKTRHRRRTETRRPARPGRLPFDQSPLCFLLQSVELGWHLLIVLGIRRQRSSGLSKRVRSHRQADFSHRYAGPWC